MVGFFINFLTLFGLIQFFERGRGEIDMIRIAAVAVIPTIVALVVGVVVGLFISPYIFNFTVTSIFLALVTFASLRRILDIPAKRSIWYAIAIVSVNALVGNYVL